MCYKNIRITYKDIFCVALFILLVSRILVLTDNYTWPIDPVRLEMLYLLLSGVLVLLAQGGKLRIRRGKYLYVLAALLLHTVLWGKVFIDHTFADLIAAYFRSQIMFVVILCVTVYAVQRLHAEADFLKCSCFALSVVLLTQLLRNISQLDLSNIMNIMSVADRTRANFGFGHYNTLGAACVCNILLIFTIRDRQLAGRFIVADILALIVSAVMLLGSASRSALTSLILYFMVYALLSMDQLPVSKRMIAALRVLTVVAALALMGYVLLEVDMDELLVETQRSHLFTHTLPMFFDTDKIWLGLGFASNVAYANRQTPYLTYWMDNGYIYILITTGIIGLAVLMSALWCIAADLLKGKNMHVGKRMIAVFCVYLYISLFETILFSSGGIVNYIYLPWLIIAMMDNRTEQNGLNDSQSQHI